MKNKPTQVTIKEICIVNAQHLIISVTHQHVIKELHNNFDKKVIKQHSRSVRENKTNKTPLIVIFTNFSRALCKRLHLL